MNETVRRRMLWITLCVAAGFFVVTLVLAATGNLTSGWYVLGAAVYGGVFVLAVIGFIVERGPEPGPNPLYVQVGAAPAAMPEPPPAPRAVLRQERVIYTTRSGQVVETLERDDDHGLRRDFIVETEGRAAPVEAVEDAIAARGWRAGRDPDAAELRRALERWGRLREVS